MTHPLTKRYAGREPTRRRYYMRDLVADLYEAHAQDLTLALALMLGDREEAEDLCHEVFVRAVLEEGRLRAHPDPRGWLFRTGYNLARGRWRLLWRRRHAIARELPVVPEEAWERAVEVRESLERLSPKQRDAVILHYYLGFDVQETAAALGCAEGTVKSHLYRARESLGRTFRPKEAN